MHKEYDFRRLNTKEDRFYIHKILGTFSVVSFFYRYAYVYHYTGNLGFSNFSRFDHATMFFHLMLALSAIRFRVPKKRTVKPLIVYEEYRLHAIVFTVRCYSVFYCVMLKSMYTPIVVVCHHLLADAITREHGTGGYTAVRAEKIQKGKIQKSIAYFYSYYQFLAVGSHILVSDADMAFNTLVAIQSSVFLMTLYKKKIIRGRVHMIIYSGCLILSTYHILRVLETVDLIVVTCCFMLRVFFNWNKYLIWSAGYFLSVFNKSILV